MSQEQDKGNNILLNFQNCEHTASLLIFRYSGGKWSHVSPMLGYTYANKYSKIKHKFKHLDYFLSQDFKWEYLAQSIISVQPKPYSKNLSLHFM